MTVRGRRPSALPRRREEEMTEAGRSRCNRPRGRHSGAPRSMNPPRGGRLGRGQDPDPVGALQGDRQPLPGLRTHCWGCVNSCSTWVTVHEPMRATSNPCCPLQTSLTGIGSGSPKVFPIRMSSPFPPSNVSLPNWPTKKSAPSPPCKVSLPGPPNTWSSPSSPKTLSFPILAGGRVRTGAALDDVVAGLPAYDVVPFLSEQHVRAARRVHSCGVAELKDRVCHRRWSRCRDRRRPGRHPGRRK